MLKDVYALRRKIVLGVYAVITLDLPLYFLLGYTFMQVAVLAVVGWVVAGTAIYLAFAQIIRLRKRSSYSTLLMLNVADSDGSAEAGQRVLDLVKALLRPDMAFLTLLDGEDRHAVIASLGISVQSALDRLESQADLVETALRVCYPLEMPSRVGDISVMLVPVVALKRPIGLLYLAGSPRNTDLGDRQLLSAVGAAIGMSLDNLRQRELLLQKESRLRSVMTGAPVVVFAIDRNGVTTFMEGSVMERLGVTPDRVVGRAMEDVYANYPQIIQSFRRAFAGEQVTATAAIQTATAQVLFEYRLAPERDEKGRVVGVIGVATDVTEQKKAEEALNESRRALETLVGNLPGAAYRIRREDERWTLEYVSDGIREITGLEPMAFLSSGQSFLDLVYPDDVAYVRACVREAIENQVHYRMEYRIRAAGGSEKWVWEQGQPIYDTFGQVVAIEGFLTDISERKRAEQRLAESERFLSTLVGNLPGFVVRTTAEPPYRVLYLSKGAEELLGYPLSEMVGRGINEYLSLVNAEDRLAVEATERAVAEGRPFETEFRIRTKSGEERWFWEQGEVVTDESGNPVAIEAFVMDVTGRKRAEQQLAESERFLRMLVGNLPGFVLRGKVGPPYVIEYVSQGVKDLLGWDPAEWLGQDVTPVFEGIHPEDKERFFGALRQAVVDGRPFAVEFRMKRKDGAERWLWEQGEVVANEDGGPALVEAFVMDVTERKLAEERLLRSEERYRDLFDNALDAIFSCDLKGRFLSANKRIQEITGYSREELMSLTVTRLIAPEYHGETAANMRKVFEGDTSPFEIEVITKDGRIVPMEVSARVVMSGGKAVGVQGIARDISERRQAEETIRRLAYHDILTGLPNRALFEDRLEMALAQARRTGNKVVVMFLDLDGFKVVNDTLGHSAGDRLLVQVARDLQALVRDGDTVARVGGDEFTVLLPDIERMEDAIDVARRILESLQQPRVIDGQEFRTTGSIGITSYPEDGEDADTLLRNADTAMYRAKDGGRDNYQLYTPGMNARVVERLAFEKDLRHAIRENHFRLFYQPIVSVGTGEITGAEALLRWEHPDRGIIAPDDFIPFAEESGLIVEIGEVVLRKACEQLMAWQGAGLPISRICVNLSARQLQQEDLSERVARVLAETGAPAEMIQLEITEGAVLKNVDYIAATLRELRALGLGVALDDFGTGYSSLTYLKRLPIDAVKIDRSFVRDMEHDASDATIVSTVIVMAKNLGLKSIAEGVETERQLEILREHGCVEFQGYLVARPLPAERFEEMVRSRCPRLNGAGAAASSAPETTDAAAPRAGA